MGMKISSYSYLFIAGPQELMEQKINDIPRRRDFVGYGYSMNNCECWIHRIILPAHPIIVFVWIVIADWFHLGSSIYSPTHRCHPNEAKRWFDTHSIHVTWLNENKWCVGPSLRIETSLSSHPLSPWRPLIHHPLPPLPKLQLNSPYIPLPWWFGVGLVVVGNILQRPIQLL